MYNFFSEFLTITTIFLFAIISPGPDFIVVSKQSLTYGKKAGILTAIGISLGNLLIVFFTLFGLSLLLIKYNIIFYIIKYSGAVFLLYLGYKALKSNGMQDNNTSNNYQKSSSNFSFILLGFFTTLLNPKAILFLVSVFSLVIKVDTLIFYKTIYAIWELILVLTWFVFVAMVLSNKKLKKAFFKYSKYIDKTLGFILIVFAIKLLFT